MRTYRLPLLGLVLLLMSAFVPFSSAADGEGITVRGRVTAYVDITVPETVTLSDADIRITTSGRFAGFYLLPDTGARPTVGALHLPRAGAGVNGGRLIQLGDDWTLYPGGYRLYLLAETPTEVFLPLDGFASRAYSPVHRADVRLHSLDFTARASEDSAERRIRLPLRGRRTLVAAAELVSSVALTGADAVHTCVTRASLECSGPVVPTLRPPATTARSSSAAVQPAGTYDAVFSVQRAAGIHGETKVVATALTLALQ